MQKWCPEPFEVSSTNVVTGVREDANAEFTALQGSAGSKDPAAATSRFRREAGFATPDALMAHLTSEERATVFELVELDVTRVYEEKLAAAAAEAEGRLAEHVARTHDWAEGFQEAINGQLRNLAASCVDLAIQVAGKIVREKVALDRAPLVRALEVALFKIPTGHKMNITVNPADAAWLEQEAGLRERLNLGQVTADRRIEPGGCVIEAGGHEWDATIGGQLEALSQLVAEQVEALKVDKSGPLQMPLAGESEVVDEAGVE